MQKIGNITNTADVNGEWTNGNVAAGTPPTILDAAWLNTVQRELSGVVTGSGLTLDPANDGQVLAGLKLLMNKALTGVVGATRNAAMSIPTASASATFTADELIVETPAGTQYRLNSFSKSINVSIVGAGGMDVALTTSAYVAIYAIYNPTTGVSALLGFNSTSSVAPNIYGGANMPAGFTASALVSVWLVSSGLLATGYQCDRECFPANLLVTSGVISTTTAAVTTFPTGSFPQNAKTISGYVTVTAAASQTAELWLLTKPILSQGVRFAVNASSISASGIGLAWGYSRVPISNPGTLYYSAFGSTATAFPVGINLTGYTI